MLLIGAPAARSAIAPAPAASRALRHRLTPQQVATLAGRRLSDRSDRSAAVAALRSDLGRLLGADHPRFLANLGDERPMERFDDVVVGEGIRAGTLGYDASLFAVDPRGGLFAVIKGGDYGADVAQFGRIDVLGRGDARHRYLEFTDLHE